MFFWSEKLTKCFPDKHKMIRSRWTELDTPSFCRFPTSRFGVTFAKGNPPVLWVGLRPGARKISLIFLRWHLWLFSKFAHEIGFFWLRERLYRVLRLFWEVAQFRDYSSTSRVTDFDGGVRSRILATRFSITSRVALFRASEKFGVLVFVNKEQM
jgi:hypothetical protein